MHRIATSIAFQMSLLRFSALTGYLVESRLASISTLLGSPNSCLACYGNEWVHDPKRQPYLIDS